MPWGMGSVENVTGPQAFHAEGPVWHPGWGGLRYVDMTAGDLLTLTGDGVTRRHVGTVAAFVRPRRDGGFVVALEHALALADDAVGLDELAADPPERLALVLGTEGDGMARRTLGHVDVTVTIPMAGGVDSLNVAAAGAVAAWELRVR